MDRAGQPWTRTSPWVRTEDGIGRTRTRVENNITEDDGVLRDHGRHVSGMQNLETPGVLYETITEVFGIGEKDEYPGHCVV